MIKLHQGLLLLDRVTVDQESTFQARRLHQGSVEELILALKVNPGDMQMWWRKQGRAQGGGQTGTIPGAHHIIEAPNFSRASKKNQHSSFISSEDIDFYRCFQNFIEAKLKNMEFIYRYPLSIMSIPSVIFSKIYLIL